MQLLSVSTDRVCQFCQLPSLYCECEAGHDMYRETYDRAVLDGEVEDFDYKTLDN